jgi:hypothetical protein
MGMNGQLVMEDDRHQDDASHEVIGKCDKKKTHHDFHKQPTVSYCPSGGE